MEVLTSILLLHGSSLRLNSCAHSNPVSYADSNLFERARMARTEVAGQRRSLYQARQCICLDRGHARAQRFADRFAKLNWPKILNQYAKLVTPQLQDLLKDCPHYWVTAQSELSTDILFKTRQHLCELYPKLLSHGTLCFGAKEVMNFP